MPPVSQPVAVPTPPRYAPACRPKVQVYLGHGKAPPLKVVQALADQAGFTRWSEARQVIEEIVTALRDWNEVAKALGISPRMRQQIAQQLDALQKANRALWTR